jgi:hypothetical protein
MAERLIDPVNDEQVPRVDNAVSVGEDLKFQERWWRFERVVWWFFLLVLVADALGVFGRGWLAKAEDHRPGSGIDVFYERVERAETSSVLRVSFRPDAVVNGKAQLFISDSVVKKLGAQRIAPQPESSVIGNGGITYTFPVNAANPGDVEIGMQPEAPGIAHFTVQVPGREAVSERVVVMP